MKASTRYSIAVQLCLILQQHKGEVVSSTYMAQSVKTNPVVIRRLIKDLVKNNIIESMPGSKGGFRLKKPADQITLWDIYVVTRDEEFFKIPTPNPDCVVSSNLKKLVFDVFSNAELAMKETLYSTSIADLNEELEQMKNQPATSN